MGKPVQRDFILVSYSLHLIMSISVSFKQGVDPTLVPIDGNGEHYPPCYTTFNFVVGGL